MSCPMCGSKGKRVCPSLNGGICSSCCGLHRVSKINCPPDCAHNPFGPGQYDAFLAVERSFDAKAMECIMKHYGRNHVQEVVCSTMWQDEDRDAQQAIVIGNAIYLLLFFRKDPQGKMLADLWREAGCTGLTNDERIVLEARSKASATVVEIQRVMDRQAMQCVDLLSPEKGVFIVLDRSSAARAIRFSTIMTWVDHYPAFSRFGAGGGVIPENVLDAFLDNLKKKAGREYGKPDFAAMKRYLSEHFGECIDGVGILARDWRKSMLQNMDFFQCIGTYRICGDIRQILTVLEQKPEFEKDEEENDEKKYPGAKIYDWVRRGDSKVIENSMPFAFRHGGEDEGVGSLGILRLYQDRLEVEAFSKKKYAFAKKMTEKYFGKEVSFQREKIVDVAKQMAEHDPEEREDEEKKETKAGSGKLPPEIERKLLSQFHEKHYQKFLDSPVPALRGMTPRAASLDPASRPLLIDLMKGHVRNLEAQNKERGLKLSLDSVLDELGLPELK